MPADDENQSRREAKQNVAIARLAANGNYSQAAESAGVQRRTIGRWMEDPTFRSRVREARTEYLVRVQGALATAAPTAVEVLLEVASNRAHDPGPRVRAAEVILRQHAKSQELSALQDQLDELKVMTLALEVAVSP